MGLSPLDKEVKDLEKARTCAYQANYHLICATKYRRKVLVGTVRVRLEELLKMIAERHGYVLLAARVHDDNHMHLKLSYPPAKKIGDEPCYNRSKTNANNLQSNREQIE